jgi:hypothetical protein
MDNRAQQLLARYAPLATSPKTTIWGPYRCFDGLFLARFAGGDTGGGNRLLAETLDMIDANLADEVSGRGDKWHLADFAMHAVWRGVQVFGKMIDPGLRRRIGQCVVKYRYHSGGMSENHNLLQHAMRHLAGAASPEARFFDGRRGAVHRDEATGLIRQWTDLWLRKGSEEWGSDIYENVNLLSLLNLHDYGTEPDIRAAARAVLDLLAREMALNAMAGSTSGAARRGYGCYRLSARNSPSRPLHWLWFGSDVRDFAVPWFIGGVLVAALSPYHPPEETVALARHPGPLHSSDHNTRPYLPPNDWIRETFRVTTRLPGVQLSGTIIPASASRYTDFTWVAVFDADAVVMANHPRLTPPAHAGTGTDHDGDPAQAILDAYARGDCPVDEREWWVPGNMPPGAPGDYRPGYWQGHGSAPACWMRDNCLLCLFDIDPSEPLHWFHLFLPVKYFDQVEQRGQWLFARRGQGRIRVWSSAPLQPVREGVWRDAEWRCPQPRGGLLVEIASGADWPGWLAGADQREPGFDATQPAISCNHAGERVRLDRRAAFPDALLPPRRRSGLS